MSFAEPMRYMLTGLFIYMGYDAKQIEKMYTTGKEIVPAGLIKSPRKMMQLLGTEWGRNCVDADLWVKAAKRKIEKISAQAIVFDDIRFENEAAMIRGLGGLIIHIDRGDLITDEHASESGINDHVSDAFVDNDHSLADFLMDIELVVNGHQFGADRYDQAV